MRQFPIGRRSARPSQRFGTIRRRGVGASHSRWLEPSAPRVNGARARCRSWWARTSAVRALTNALRQNRLHHAWLLTAGEATLARIMAKALNCETGSQRRRAGLRCLYRHRQRPLLSTSWSWMPLPTRKWTTCASCWRTRCTPRPAAALRSTLSMKCICSRARPSTRCSRRSKSRDT